MKHLALLFAFLYFNLNGQFQIIKDSLDDPNALAFVGDDLYVTNQGTYPLIGQIAKLNINSPESTYEILFDSLPYPRSIIAKDSILYIGFPSEIKICDLRKDPLVLEDFIFDMFSFPRAFAVYKDNIFIAAEGKLSSIDISSDDPSFETVIDYFSENVLSLAVNGDELYIATGKEIHIFDIIERKFRVLPFKSDEVIYSILAINGFLYVDQGTYSPNLEEIIKIDLLDQDYKSQVFCYAPSSIGMVEYNGSIYFASQKPKFDGKPEGKIIRIDKTLDFRTEFNSLILFPNPTTGEIKFNSYDYTNYSIKIYCRNGQLVKQLSSPINIDISDFPAGLYFLKVNDKLVNKSQYFKVVKVD